MFDLMVVMFEQKIGYLLVGVNIVWVLLLIVVILYVLYYYKVDVFVCQVELVKCILVLVDDILIILLVLNINWIVEEIKNEVDNNVQGIFGYVVCWIDQGVGCFKVLDINDVGLMEDCVILCIFS